MSETRERERDEYGRATYASNEIPPKSEHFALWRGKRTHPDAIHTPSIEKNTAADRHHDALCVGGWIPSGEWWLHCGICGGAP